MGMNQTPAANRVHIGFFGRRNAGKSSVVNAVTNQEIAVVSEVRGTTTDPVYKTMELLPVGPVMIIDTPGYDDEGSLGELRVRRTKQVLNKTDVAVLVVDATAGMTEVERELTGIFAKKEIPYIIAYNKADLLERVPEAGAHEIYISAREKSNIYELKEKIAALSKEQGEEKRLVGDLVKANDFVVLVTPIDSAAPKGRLILPQQQTIRDLLESGAVSVVIRETELKETLDSLGKKTALVITDSQAFAKVSAETSPDIPLTSFSILMARYKGTLEASVRGAAQISRLQEGDAVLIAEGCTHHRQCEDIGTVKLPRWLREFTGRNLQFSFTSGTEFPEDLSTYRLIIHCGGCMLNEREMRYRIQTALDAGVPVTNYGTAIAYMNGILKRSLAVLPDIQKLI
ncbi:[FeFe] hydrogenase H-cluster maturation GTPase HydF [Marvinbryantia formatexigens]|nr:[FeFe] hydrogenase H-cluster maturation GTPase HydF [Marvinbryantia formatexigens]UWO24748.1 [FeFe] hydrogenase H-cluster maturation GTPase HydF [Marvinbryantia formatexigens DSM 14469]SDF21715.1 iron-only hydrogenase maturation protein HydF [Marvinbryantia formatexigens]